MLGGLVECVLGSAVVEVNVELLLRLMSHDPVDRGWTHPTRLTISKHLLDVPPKSRATTISFLCPFMNVVF